MTGERLKTIIERSGLRTNEMASRLGMLPQQLNNVFHTNDVKTGIVEKVADIIGVPVCTLYGVTGKLKPHLTAGLVNKVGRVRPDPLKQRCKGSHLFSTLQAFQKL